MKISTRSQYILYITVLHILLILLVYQLLFQNKLLFIAVEILLFISIVISVQLFRNFMQPIQFIRSGIEAIKDKDFTIKFVPTGRGEVDTLIEVYNLMIDQLREERTKLNEQHFFLEKLIDASPISILILDFDEKVASLNEKARVLFQIEDRDIIGKSLAETGLSFLPGLDELPDGESRIIKTNGIATFRVLRSHFMSQGFKRSFLMIEELTAEILETEKRAYGKVIRMMAHEVNNTLGATDSILQTTSHVLSDEKFWDIREALLIASERNQQLTRFMRNFADVVRLPLPSRENTDVNRLVKNVAVFMESMAARQGVSIELILSESENSVPMDAGQMEHVLVNIIKNAVEACSAGDQIKAEVFESRIVISNNGKPIDADVAMQLFDPFFSTRHDGQGIGLTLTREILSNHGFTFSLKTVDNGWTQFVIETGN